MAQNPLFKVHPHFPLPFPFFAQTATTKISQLPEIVNRRPPEGLCQKMARIFFYFLQ